MQQKVEKWLHYVECSHFLLSARALTGGVWSWIMDVLITVKLMGKGGGCCNVPVGWEKVEKKNISFIS